MWIDQQPQIIYTVRDGTDTSGLVKFHARAGVEAAAAHAGATQRRGLLAAVTGCVLVRQSVSYSRIESAPAAPLVGALAPFVGVFVFDTATAGQFAVLTVPGLLPALLMTTGCAAGLDVDRTQPAIVALVEHLQSGSFCNPWGYQLGDLVAAYMQERR